MVNAIKVNFIKLLSSFDGMQEMPKDMLADYKQMLAKLKDPAFQIPAKQQMWMSTVIASLFCALPVPAFPMNDANKKLIVNFSKKHLVTPDNTPTSNLAKKT